MEQNNQDTNEMQPQQNAQSEEAFNKQQITNDQQQQDDDEYADVFQFGQVDEQEIEKIVQSTNITKVTENIEKFRKLLYFEKLSLEDSKFLCSAIQKNIHCELCIEQKFVTNVKTKKTPKFSDISHGIISDLFWKKKPNAGGLYFVDKQTISQQTSVLKHLATSMGKNLIQGKSVVNISLPVIVFDTESFLERLAAQFSYAPIYLENAGKEERPINQFINVLAFNITSLHLGMGQNKPFNPILGETFQDHPPISSLLYFGKNVQVTATLEACVNLYPNTAAAKMKGIYRAKFASTQQEIWFTKPQFKVKNMLVGERYINAENKVIHINFKEAIYCEIIFHPDKKSLLKGLFSKSKHPKDYYSGKIYKTTPQFIEKFKKLGIKNDNYDQLLTLFNPKTDIIKEIANVSGIWHESMHINDQLIWKIDHNKPYALIRQKNPLPSDGIYRLDSLTWKSKEKKEAQQMKEFLENIQRNDRKLRADYQKLQISLQKSAGKQKK